LTRIGQGLIYVATGVIKESLMSSVVVMKKGGVVIVILKHEKKIDFSRYE